MASPSAETFAVEQPRKITFRFCRECSNMLYPKEDKANNTLMFACRTCTFSEAATSSCVFRNELSNTVGETAGITQDVGSDPTVGVLHFCVMCGQEILCEICQVAEAEGLRVVVVDKDVVDGDAILSNTKERRDTKKESMKITNLNKKPMKTKKHTRKAEHEKATAIAHRLTRHITSRDLPPL